MTESQVIVTTEVEPRVPGMAAWKPFQGQEYTVFVDESFHKFFNFGHQDGTFVHGAVGIPTPQYDNFQRMFHENVGEYNAAINKSTGVKARELKSTDLYKLPFNLRRRLVLRLVAALAG